MDLRPVGPEHSAYLATFSCATPGLEFTLDVEEDIRRHVAGELASGQCEALGSWDGAALAAVIVYTKGDWLWKVTVLATDYRYRGRRQAMRLKLAVLDLARQAGAAAVTSHVHGDNLAMRRLNKKLSGVEEPSSDPESPYLICTVPVPH